MTTITAKKPKELVVNNDMIMLNHNLITIPSSASKVKTPFSNMFTSLGTIFANLAYYGFALSNECIEKLKTLNQEQIGEWWTGIEPSLKEITGDNRQMDKHVVYKNFPQEVLDMSISEYWIKQMFMYIGCPNEWFTEEEMSREKINENIKYKILHLADDNSLSKIFNKVCNLPARWTEGQFKCIEHLISEGYSIIDISQISFKENMILYVKHLISIGAIAKISSAMDVLRLAIGLSEGDITMRTNTKFRKFTRKERKLILGLLEQTSDPLGDAGRDPERWKRLLHNLHPNEYGKKYSKVCEMYNLLYNNETETFNSKVEALVSKRNPEVLNLLKSRPGDFMRRFANLLNIFGEEAATAFTKVLPSLNISQLLKIEGYLNTINERIFRTIAPKGNWTKLRVEDNKTRLNDNLRIQLLVSIGEVIKNKLSKKYTSVRLDEATKNIKLQTNDSDVTPYGRGTSFPIPDNVQFIRTASYWEQAGSTNWFDNGWNFFDTNWKAIGTCCWSATMFGDKSAIFSGDPVSAKTPEGKACQMIDLYLDKLAAQGVRYAVWNILCYSRIKFSEATEVFGGLLWGEDAQKGKLFEPSRAQLAFQIKSDTLTKYLAYIDLVERKLVYIDANLNGSVATAVANAGKLENVMPGFVEYLDTLPSIYDLFSKLDNNENGLPVVYDDIEVSIKDEVDAYVFKTSNADNKFKQININELLSL